jgi:hypothetical protein
MALDVIFAWIVGVLAALAVIGALTFALVWEWTAIRRVMERHRAGSRPPTDEDFWRQQRALIVPERRQ